MTRSVIPFGPQHPVLPEPVNLRLELEDERVVGAVPVIGYVQRGIEKAAELNDFRYNVFLAERVCGICSFTHAWTYCQGIETIMGVKIPERAEYLRVVYSECGRLQSHMLWLGLFADAFGYESLFMQIWRAREMVLDINEMIAGHRVILSTCAIGGLRRDIDAEMAKTVTQKLNEFKAIVDKTVVKIITNDYTIKQRTTGVGILTREQAQLTGAVGPMARGSDLAMDIRQTGYGAYRQLGFEPVVEKGCDCYARMLVRMREVYQSIDLIQNALKMMPSGEYQVKVTGFPKGESIFRTEQPRGELLYYLKGNGTKNLDRMRVRTPTFANIPPLLTILPGCQLADVPVIVLSIDPCISCTER
jgi:ech hydrogenase subunit E